MPFSKHTWCTNTGLQSISRESSLLSHIVFMLRSVDKVALTVRGSSSTMTPDLASAGIVAKIAAASGLLITPVQHKPQ